MTPWELREASANLNDEWNKLYAQLVGRTVQGRAEVADDFQNQVSASRNSYRKWYDTLLDRPIEEALGLYGGEYQNQLQVYRGIVAQSQKVLKTLGEQPGFDKLDQWVERPSGFVPGVVVGIGILLLGWYLTTKKKTTSK
jgi:hypothetical protein